MLVLFFTKEIVLALQIDLFATLIPDWLFLLIFFEYVVLEYLPVFKPEWIDGYEKPEVDIDEGEDDLEDLTDEERELKELEDISL